MAFDNPVTVELFDENDDIIMPVTAPISIVNNVQAHDFDYIAVQVETYDTIMREVLKRWTNKELIQYRVSGRFGVQTGDINSVYAYDAESGEFSFYGRSHKEIFHNVLGFIDPSLNAVQRTYSMTHADYKGSALKVVRDVMTDNLVNRIGVPMTFPAGNLGNQVDVDFRFDEIHKHLWEDGEDRGGAKLAENGNIVFDIYRDFDKHRFVMTAREPVHHEQMIVVRSGLIERWQMTSDRGEANRVVVGGPREMEDRVFGSTEADGEAPKVDTVAKAERAQIEANITALGKTRDSAKKTIRSESSAAVKALQKTLRKAEDAAKKKYSSDLNKAKKKYDAAMKKAKTQAAKDTAKYTYDSEKRSAASTRDSSISSAKRTYNDDLKAENEQKATDLKTADQQYKMDVATQKQLLTTLLKEWPYPNRRFPAEMYTEDTTPENVDSEKLNPSDPQEAIAAIPEIAEALNKTAVTKRTENGPYVTVSGQLLESDTFYLGGTIQAGDYVMIGVDEELLLGEQEIEKAIIAWSKDEGYKVQLSKPDDTETTEEETLKRITSALKDLSTKTGRR